MTVVLLLVSFVLILGGAVLFTNAVEWLGKRLGAGAEAGGRRSDRGEARLSRRSEAAGRGAQSSPLGLPRWAGSPHA